MRRLETQLADKTYLVADTISTPTLRSTPAFRLVGLDADDALNRVSLAKFKHLKGALFILDAKNGWLLGAVEVLRPALTAPGFDKALVVFVGWVSSTGPHAVTGALVATDVARRRHHEAFHRFFSRGSWLPDDLGWLLFEKILDWLPKEPPVHVVIDDTLAPKKDAHVFGIGSHLDAVRSTKRFASSALVTPGW